MFVESVVNFSYSTFSTPESNLRTLIFFTFDLVFVCLLSFIISNLFFLCLIVISFSYFGP